MVMELYSKHPTGATIFLVAAAAIAGAINYFTPEPIPPKPKPPITQRVKQRVNRYKIERAEKKWKEQQQEKPAPTETPEVAPVDSSADPRMRDRVKDWLRDKLNEDYKNRHPQEADSGNQETRR
jgi:hypothetical protein